MILLIKKQEAFLIDSFAIFNFYSNYLNLTQEKKDILNIEDIKLLVDTFYDKVREDQLIGPIFDEKIQDRWPEHLAKMYTFWQTVLLGEHTYYGSPFPPHANLPVEQIHFERWLALFAETLNELFSGEVAKEAIWRANKMAIMFQYKIEHYRNNPTKSLI
ncbi:MAG TPA: group III truncated hemoglobin [Hanamia sp.]|jgi:hemoglobin|nr:group III truncated hemoglobin [Hanamia sp.]